MSEKILLPSILTGQFLAKTRRRSRRSRLKRPLLLWSKKNLW